jgi:hypothetical protein
MNNSFVRLIDGMIETLRRDVIPATEGEFVRGQAFGVIFLLENLKRRASWSRAFLGEQVAALTELRLALEAIDAPAGLPRLSPIADASEAARDTGDAEVAALIDWLAHTPCSAAAAVVDTYLTRQIRHELATSAKPMFAEISLGREQ